LSEIVNIQKKSDGLVDKRSAVYQVMDWFSEFIERSKAASEIKIGAFELIMKFLEENKNVR